MEAPSPVPPSIFSNHPFHNRPGCPQFISTHAQRKPTVKLASAAYFYYGKLTFADRLSASPFLIGSTSPGFIPNKHVAVFALVADDGVISASCVDRFSMSGVLWGWTLNSCNHNTRKPPTQLSLYLQRRIYFKIKVY